MFTRIVTLRPAASPSQHRHDPSLQVSAPEIVSGMSGESEAKLRQLFAEARDLAPCIVFIGASERRTTAWGGKWRA